MIPEQACTASLRTLDLLMIADVTILGQGSIKSNVSGGVLGGLFRICHWEVGFGYAAMYIMFHGRH